MQRNDNPEHHEAGEPAEPDTIPDTRQDGELLDAIEWLKKAGVVSVDSKPPFSTFFEEVVKDAS